MAVAWPDGSHTNFDKTHKTTKRIYIMFDLYVLSKMRLMHPERPLGLLAIILLFTPYLRAALIPCAGRHNFVVNRVEARSASARTVPSPPSRAGRYAFVIPQMRTSRHAHHIRLPTPERRSFLAISGVNYKFVPPGTRK
jgi:hypothetical protein